MTGSPSALEGVRVLDLSHLIAGPFCARLLADYGAEVLKIERPSVGDGARRMGPFPGGKEDPEKSGTFLYLNFNKRGMTLDLKRPAGRRIVLDLVKRADVLVESFRPGVMDRLGLDYGTLTKANPDLVMVSISNFGQTGPYRDYKANELIAYAMGGQMHSTGLPDREPVKLGGNIGLYQTGEAAAFGASLALFRKEMGGGGDHVDISIFETQASSQDRRSIYMLNYQYTGATTKRHGDSNGLAFGIFPCKDGYVCFWSGVNRFPRVAQMVGRPELADDPFFADRTSHVTPEAIDAFNIGILLPWLMERDMNQVWAESQAAGLATAPIFSIGHFFADSYFRERGFWETIDHPVAGKLEYPGHPIIMKRTPWRVRRPAPLLGQHSEEVICSDLGRGKADYESLREEGVV